MYRVQYRIFLYLLDSVINCPRCENQNLSGVSPHGRAWKKKVKNRGTRSAEEAHLLDVGREKKLDENTASTQASSTVSIRAKIRTRQVAEVGQHCPHRGSARKTVRHYSSASTMRDPRARERDLHTIRRRNVVWGPAVTKHGSKLHHLLLVVPTE